MVQAYGFTPKQSTRRLDVIQHTDEVHEHKIYKKNNKKKQWNAFRLFIIACFVRDITQKKFKDLQTSIVQVHHKLGRNSADRMQFGPDLVIFSHPENKLLVVKNPFQVTFKMHRFTIQTGHTFLYLPDKISRNISSFSSHFRLLMPAFKHFLV